MCVLICMHTYITEFMFRHLAVLFSFSPLFLSKSYQLDRNRICSRSGYAYRWTYMQATCIYMYGVIFGRGPHDFLSISVSHKSFTYNYMWEPVLWGPKTNWSHPASGLMEPANPMQANLSTCSWFRSPVTGILSNLIIVSSTMLSIWSRQEKRTQTTLPERWRIS